jgi:hypothetical protein
MNLMICPDDFLVASKDSRSCLLTSISFTQSSVALAPLYPNDVLENAEFQPHSLSPASGFFSELTDIATRFASGLGSEQ